MNLFHYKIENGEWFVKNHRKILFYRNDSGIKKISE